MQKISQRISTILKEYQTIDKDLPIREKKKMKHLLPTYMEKVKNNLPFELLKLEVLKLRNKQLQKENDHLRALKNRLRTKIMFNQEVGPLDQGDLETIGRFIYYRIQEDKQKERTERVEREREYRAYCLICLMNTYIKKI